MRKFVSLFAVASLAAGLVLIVATPAGAAAPTKASDFCKAVKNFDAGSLAKPTSEEDASQSLVQLEKLQAVAKGNLKKKLTKIVDADQKVVDGGSVTALSNGIFVKAASKFEDAASKCVVGVCPDCNLL